MGEAGKTGEWRTQRPVVDHAVCLPEKNQKQACFRCWMYCPEAVIKKHIPIEIDLTYCKGCGICAAECPGGAISMVTEAGADEVDSTEGQ
jgi:pyruvate ferredoxin oxidoreductase delta subunit